MESPPRSETAPERRWWSELAWAGAAAVAMGAAVLWFRSQPAIAGQLQGSTEAWIIAHVHRVLLAGDYAAATGASMVPNTTWNSLYPALVVGLVRLGGGTPLVVGQAVSAAAFGLAAVALARCWWSTGGPVVGVGAGLCLFFPPVVGTASMARYDLLALALVLCAGWALVVALERGSLLAWATAGVLVGLVYHAREFLLAPALGGLVVALGLALWEAWRRGAGRRRPLRLLAVLGCALAGLAAGLLPLPLSLGLDPLSGVQALAAYAHDDRAGDPRPWSEVLYLRPLGWAFGLGLLGLLLAAARPGRRGHRRGALILLGTLLPFAAFLASRQQSSQYYLLADILLLSGLAGLLTPIPWRWLQAPILGLALVLAAPWAHVRIADTVDGRIARPRSLHSEAWPADVGEASQVMRWALERADGRALVVVSGAVENIDALAPIEHGRPVAALFREWLPRLDEAAALCDGEEPLVLSVESPRQPPNEIPGGRLVERFSTAHLAAELWIVSAQPAPVTRGEPVCARGGQIPGACLQHAWLQGGDEELRRRILGLHERYRGLQGWRSMWW